MIIDDVFSQEPEVIDLWYFLLLAHNVSKELHTITRKHGYAPISYKISNLFRKLNYEVDNEMFKNILSKLRDILSSVKSLSNDTILMRVLLRAETQLENILKE